MSRFELAHAASSHTVVKSFNVTRISSFMDGTEDDCIHECTTELSLSSGDSVKNYRHAPGAWRAFRKHGAETIEDDGQSKANSFLKSC